MSTHTWPTGFHWLPAQFELTLRSNVLVSASPLTGAMDTLEIPGARWVARLALDPAPYDDQAAREAFFSQLAGQANRVQLWHFARPVPRGTMRGSPTLTSTAAKGATTIAITGTGTLKTGDMLGIGGQLVQVVADAPSLASVQIRPALRAAKPAATAIVWDKPLVKMMLTSPEVSVPYLSSRGAGMTIEAVEDFA